MPTEWDYEPNKPTPGAWVTIGSFDGVHRGHQTIIKKMVEESHKENKKCVVVTFFPHPIKVLRNLESPYYLNSPEEKNQILKNLGVDSIMTLHFNHDLSKLSAGSFIHMLYDQLKFTCLLIGYDFRFGANRSGDFHTLTEFGKELGYCVRAIEPFKVTSQPVSSSSIRNLITAGKIQAANELLGYSYTVKGRVVRGDGRGKHIGLPTANLDVWEEKLLPPIGIYAAFIDIDGKRYKTALSIGVRPTFYKHPSQQTIEAHILDFDSEIYGKEVVLRFMRHIRPEMKFDNAQTLMVQINQDIQFTREVLAHEPEETNLSA